MIVEQIQDYPKNPALGSKVTPKEAKKQAECVVY